MNSFLVLKKGFNNSELTKESVKQWQQFLYGYFTDHSNNTSSMNFDDFIIDGIFGNLTEQYTIQFQNENCLDGDGIVGPMTIAKAIQLGYGNFVDVDIDKRGPSWPEKPIDMKALTSAEKMKMFGTIKYKVSPIKGSPENITITNNWISKYIVSVNVPQLKGIVGAPKSCNVFVNKLIVDDFKKLWEDWEKAKKLNLVLTWAGLWVPRLIRGSTTTLSSHAWGTAFDINAQWNRMGSRPALVGEKGSVRELVEIAAENGFFWLGWSATSSKYNKSSRLDGMHFEWCKLGQAIVK